MQRAIDVVVPGRPTVDLVFSPLETWPEPGREVYADALAVRALALHPLVSSVAAASRLFDRALAELPSLARHFGGRA